MTSPTLAIRIVEYGGFRLDAIDPLNRILASAFRIETGDNKDRWRVFPGKIAEQAAGFIDAAGNYEMIAESIMSKQHLAIRPVQPPAAVVNTEEGARWWLEFLAQLYLVSDLTRQEQK